MSQNHDNIYNILGKLQGVEAKHTPVEQQPTPTKIYESVEARGSILDGVTAIESKLAQEFSESKWIQKTGVEKNKGGLHKALHVAQGEKIPKGKIEKASHSKNAHLRHMAQFAKNVADEDTDVAGQQGTMGVVGEEGNEEAWHDTLNRVSANRAQGVQDRTDATVARRAQEPKTFGQKVKQDIGGPLKKLAKGDFKGALGEDPMGDAPGGADVWEGKAKNKYAIGMAAAKKSAGIKAKHAHDLPKSVITKGHEIAKHIKESRLNFKEMSDATNQTLDQMLDRMTSDIEAYKATGNMSQDLGDMVHVFNHLNKPMEEEYRGPGTMRGVTPTPTPKPSVMSKVGGAVKGALGIKSDDELKRDLQRRMGATPQQQHGQPSMGSYNEGSLEEELNKLAELAGLNMEQNTGPGTGGMEEGNKFSGELAKAREEHQDTFDVDGHEYHVNEDTIEEDKVLCHECGMEECECPDEEEKEKAIKEAQELVQMMKIAGLDTSKIEESITQMMEAKKYGDATPDEPSEEDQPVNNKDDVQYEPMRASTMNPGEGDPGEKNNFDGAGDNKMKQQPTVPAKPVKTVKEASINLEGALAAEYDSIKKMSGK